MLIRTKLLPPVQREVVPRTAALDLLRSQPGRRLILIRAPAGWGKSSLLQSWGVSGTDARMFAWLALDAGDNDPVRFFAYLIEALRGLSPEVGSHSNEILKAPGAGLVEDLLPVLLAELEARLAHREKNAEHHSAQHSLYETEGHWFESSRARFTPSLQWRMDRGLGWDSHDRMRVRHNARFGQTAWACGTKPSRNQHAVWDAKRFCCGWQWDPFQTPLKSPPARL